jgi:molybdenum cofactor sulfurtransferase
VCWNDRDIINGRPTGAVRASFGFASSLADAAAGAALVGRYFVEHKPPPLPLRAAASGAAGAAGEGRAAGGAASQPAAAGAAASGPAAGAAVGAAGVGEEGRIEGLWVYPIKSCRGFSPPAWPLGES